MYQFMGKLTNKYICILLQNNEDAKKIQPCVQTYQDTIYIYGLEQVPRPCNERWRDYSQKVSRWATKWVGKNLFGYQIFTDDIIFDQQIKRLERRCESKMSMIGELTFFIELQIKQFKRYYLRYLNDLLKKFGMKNAYTIAQKRISLLIFSPISSFSSSCYSTHRWGLLVF